MCLLRRNILEEQGVFNKKFRIKQFCDSKLAVPVIFEKFIEQKDNGAFNNVKIELLETQMLMPFSKTHLIKLASVQKMIEDEVVDLFYAKTGKSLSVEDLKDLPKEWQIHGDMLLLPKECFIKSIWKFVMPGIWNMFCKILRVSRIAKRGRINDNEYRSSKVKIILGKDGWVSRKENGITYMYDITKCMFSDGNITEKMRIANFDCSGMTVVDLFAGIGYFALPYLVHAGAKMVFACEWNPDAVEALKKNLEVNNVSDKCVILEGDNRLVCYEETFSYYHNNCTCKHLQW